MGKYGKNVKRFTESLLQKGLAHFIATDTHYVNEYFKGVEYFSKFLIELIGKENAEILMDVNPLRLWNNSEVVNMSVSKKKFFLKELFKF